ncbi:adenylyl-sulfate kinase [Deinococcus deserti]|uniref:Adenylyl-sulfate kinase n=1 Tax=Deinococcus deserti (strain DSM 17065 / CIP 109153 / LMG 22923 / VCD115) TaxID=546414 RepID=CYSC_DEIDV|nr:adenylyl-sulfate kinase [Deinococcus deserti]C1CVW7.1 RecName: Full=Adenylyl-sulfate kinase; AltName: Full=APS kinase; AltName: Full=ATP adenosine-5'-phosphosulfate 3'-phosphotransferase; AltName: Full=Adenosine-5'-phosphosulfate kinase [Deinococcus deserti VCD115]ACO46334.1 putative Adenylylsulfate kinase (APS kinase) (Adenosine 5 -phosphosulfate kinase) [Deinococcus deserti VCD115]
MTATLQRESVGTGRVVWFTGLSGAGKSTLASALYEELIARGEQVELLDGDAVRENLSKGLGFTKADRDTNVRRIAFVAGLLAKHGVTVLVSAISPYAETRREVLANLPNPTEVFVDAPLAVVTERDVKGLYLKALAGEIPHFTGVSDPYEAPENPDLHLRTDRISVQDGLKQLLDHLGVNA